MAESRFKAAQVSAKDTSERSTLVEDFNEWAEREKPASIIHVYYFHDHSARTRGYLVIFQAHDAASRQSKAA
jgi:hypothetical protein